LWYLRFVRKQKILIPFGNQDFTVFFFFKVVPPGIVLYLQVAVYHHFSEKEKG